MQEAWFDELRTARDFVLAARAMTPREQRLRPLPLGMPDPMPCAPPMPPPTNRFDPSVLAAMQGMQGMPPALPSRRRREKKAQRNKSAPGPSGRR